ncbi:MAG: hypothetical protein A2Y17_11145 [Clostridiales bacterium GWF2_38_85]|nr:MAG: hypothetical protein A2Y17_11145 [Clostridiales bacterium GWF2_38_85]HBL84681.1 hypothetical protein [Clostridiales bacterium]
MHNTLNPIIHNKFEIEVTDAVTGKVKQKGTSYNIVLDSFFNRLVSRSTKFTHIHVGTGTGTPAVTDTSLFTFLGARGCSVVETVKAYPVSYVKRVATINPADYVGSVITEVGLAYGTSSSYLVTHSMLRDSEGNQIAITKTSTDVITIYSTFYLTMSEPSDGSYVLPTPANNAIIAGVLEDTYSTLTLSLGVFNDLTTADQLAAYSISNKTGITPTSDTTNKKWTVPSTRWNYDTANSHMISAIGCPTVAAWLLPNTDIFPQITLSNMTVGTGDGVKTEFSCPIPKMVESSEAVRVNGVLMIKGTDYTIDYNNNAAEYPEFFVNTNPNNCVITGGYTNSNYSYFPFMVWGAVKTGKNSITSSAPIIFDFGNAIMVNRLYMPAGTIAFGGSGSPTTAIGFDYSDDGVSWTNLHTTATVVCTSVSADLRLVTPISARYWRITSSYISALGCGKCPNILFGYVTPGLVFTTPPASGVAITMDCKIDRPLKNTNWVLDFGFSVQFSRG